ncbi:MAG: hypothetical protein K2G55_20130, partial [Lachnospiraceae bacterium]|nr:hypothetical protein [Lachnospiraceae bacterium]
MIKKVRGAGGERDSDMDGSNVRNISRTGEGDVSGMDGKTAGDTDSRGGGLLKFITCGSVDDGKSTLIGHMLY